MFVLFKPLACFNGTKNAKKIVHFKEIILSLSQSKKKRVKQLTFRMSRKTWPRKFRPHNLTNMLQARLCLNFVHT